MFEKPRGFDDVRQRDQYRATMQRVKLQQQRVQQALRATGYAVVRGPVWALQIVQTTGENVRNEDE